MNCFDQARLSCKGFNELKVINNVEESLNFFHLNGYFPRYNERDKNEMRLYDFLRKTDFSSCKIDKRILNELYAAQELSKKKAPIIKKRKQISNKRLRITKAINNYYKYYLQNGFFPTDSKISSKEAKSISKSYTSILTLEKYYTGEHARMISMINDIKFNISNRKQLKVINQYVNFFKKYGVLPVRKKNLASIKNDFERKSHDLASKMERINLNLVRVPKLLKNELESIDNTNPDKLEKLIQTTNDWMKIIIFFIDEQNGKIYHGKLMDEKIIYQDEEVKLSTIINSVCKNIEFVDNDLKKKCSLILKS